MPDYLTYFRALVIVLEMTGQAATHREKDARLRGAIELLEGMIQKLRYSDLGAMLGGFRWPDIFRSDWPQQRLLDRVRVLEAELAEARKEPTMQAEETAAPF